MKRTLPAASFALAAIFACSVQAQTASQPKANPPGSTSASQPGAAQSGAPSQPKSIANQDKNFIEEAAQANMAEISTGKLALSKATSGEVKKYAQLMIDEHSKNLQELQAVAQAKGVKLPDAPNKAQMAKAKTLEGLSGAAFDQRYMQDVGIEEHRKAVALFKKGASSKDPDVRAYAEKTLPHVEQHLKMAQQNSPKKVAAVR